MAAIIKPKSGIINLGGMVLDLSGGGGGGGGADVSGIITAVNGMRPNTLPADADASAIATAITSNLYPLTHEKRRTFTFTPLVNSKPIHIGDDYSTILPLSETIMSRFLSDHSILYPQISLVNTLSYASGTIGQNSGANCFLDYCGTGPAALVESGDEMYIMPMLYGSTVCGLGSSFSPVLITPGQVCTIAFYVRYYFPNIIYLGVDVNGVTNGYNWDFFGLTDEIGYSRPGNTNPIILTANDVLWSRYTVPTYSTDDYDTTKTGTDLTVSYIDTEA